MWQDQLALFFLQMAQKTIPYKALTREPLADQFAKEDQDRAKSTSLWEIKLG
jgi:hypothetical protein